MGNEVVLHIVKGECSSVHKINRSKCKLIGHNWGGGREECLINHDNVWRERWEVGSERKKSKKT